RSVGGAGSIAAGLRPTPTQSPCIVQRYCRPILAAIVGCKGRDMIAAFQKAVSQLSDPALRAVSWRTLLLAILAYALVWGLSWFAIWWFTYFDIQWLNTTIKYLGAFAVTILSLLLFPATFGMILSVFLEEIANIVEERHYPTLGRAPGIPV